MKKTDNTTKFLIIYVSGVTLILLFLIIRTFQSQTSDEITVKRINIVNEDGTPAVVISNRDRIPPPILNGKEFKRAVTASGIINYNTDGNERGGIAVADTENMAMTAMVLDYTTMDAIGMMSMEDLKTNDYSAFLKVNDPDKSRKIGHGTNRLTLGTQNGNAGLVINSPDGKPRLVLEVDSINRVAFYTLDAKGNILKNWMEQ